MGNVTIRGPIEAEECTRRHAGRCEVRPAAIQQITGLTATAVVTLALGIGATAAIFTLIQQVMLRPLAVAKPEQLWRIGDAVTCC